MSHIGWTEEQDEVFASASENIMHPFTKECCVCWKQSTLCRFR